MLIGFKLTKQKSDCQQPTTENEFLFINYIYFTMKSITIKGSERESVGKKATKALRDAGMVPCVIYGGDQPVHFAAEEKAFKGLVYTPNAHTVVIELKTVKKLMLFTRHPVSPRI
jgi:large subunit ribosomal protein L25